MRVSYIDDTLANLKSVLGNIVAWYLSTYLKASSLCW
jgi:hypothetical protein